MNASQAGDLPAILRATSRIGQGRRAARGGRVDRHRRIGRTVSAALVPLLAVLVAACFRPPAIAPSVEPTVESSPTRAPSLRVGTSGDYAPFSHWPGDAREPEGFSIDVARAFAAIRGQPIEWIRFRWSGLAGDLEAGRFDLAVSGITVRPDRSLQGRFSLPLTTTGAVALVLADSSIASAVDLEQAGLRIAVNRGGHLERVARTLFARARIEAVDGNARVPDRLADGRADAVLTDDLEARVWRARLPPTRAIGPLTRDRKAAWFPLGAEALQADFDRWLLAAEASGELARLRERHGLADERSAAPLPALLARLDERLALMPAVARAKHALALPIEDPAQEARVRVAAREAAERAARERAVAPPAEPVLRRFVDAQLAAARFVQGRELAAIADRHAATIAGSDADVAAKADRAEPAHAMTADAARVELDRRLRPALAFLTERVVWLTVACAAADTNPSPATIVDRKVVAAALATHALPAELVAELAASLDALVRPARPARPIARANRARSVHPDTSPSA